MRFWFAVVAALLLWPAIAATQTTDDLIGLWQGKRIAGPEVRGHLIVSRTGQQWRADISGFRLPVKSVGDQISFRVPGSRGEFRGRLLGSKIKGHWIQPGTINNGMPHASPLELTESASGEWRGEVVPMLDEFSLYLPVRRGAGGSLRAFLRNPDRGFGVFYNVKRLELKDSSVRWVGRFFRNTEEQVLTEASYQPGRMSVTIRGNLYDLRRVDDPSSHFYARGKNPKPYHYVAPPQDHDGWAVGTLAEAGIDAGAIGEFIDTVILPPADSIDDPYIHGLLIAHSGKLVLEEYFHGFHRHKPHDTRSASKSLASVLAGAVAHAGLGLSESSPVYQTVDDHYRRTSIQGADARRTRMTLAHLLTMSSGLDCDDGNANSKGNEDRMQSQTEEPDWYRYALELDMVREPGEQAVYCSAGVNLIGAMIAGASGRGLAELLQELIAEPLEIKHYYLNLGPTGVPYLGGGIYWRPRDFIKLGQVMLNGGTWNGRRIVSEAWAKRSISTLYEMRDKGYGYAWWTIQYPYQGRNLKVFFAAGNGGQVVMGIPDLDVLIAFFAGNYSHPTLYKIQEEFVPKYILPALGSQKLQ